MTERAPSRLRQKYEKVKTKFSRVDVSPEGGIYTMPELMDKLQSTQLASPLQGLLNDGTQITVGFSIPLSPATDLLCMQNGIMQLRTTNDVADKQNFPPIWQCGPTRPQENADQVITHFLHYSRFFDDPFKDNTNPKNAKAFREAIAQVEKLVETRTQAKAATIEALHTSLSTRIEPMIEKEQEVKETITVVIDHLVEEQLGTPLLRQIDDETEVIGCVLPVPQEIDGKTQIANRRLMLLKDGSVTVIDIPDAAEIKYDSPEPVVTGQTEHDLENFLNDKSRHRIINADDSHADIEALQESYSASTQWIEQQRERRKRRVVFADLTDELFAEIKQEMTEPTIEEKAREILGEDFLGVESIKNVETYLRSIGKEVNFVLDEIPDIPYSSKDIELAKEYNEMLILRPKVYVNELGMQPLTVQDFSRLLSNGTSQELMKEGLYNENDSYAFDFDQIEFGWALVTKYTIPGSKYKLWEEQEEIAIPDRRSALVRENSTAPQARRRTAMEAIWDTTAYYITNNNKLLTTVADFTSSETHDGKHVAVIWDGNKLFLSHPDNGRYNNLGVCTTR